MTSMQPMTMNGATIRRLYWGLIVGLCLIMVALGALFLFKKAPVIRGGGASMIAWVLGGMGLAAMLVCWLRVRSSVPTPRSGASLDAYWQDPSVSGRAILVWAMIEFSVIIANIGTLLTGSYFTVGVALIGLVLMLTESPSAMEARL